MVHRAGEDAGGAEGDDGVSEGGGVEVRSYKEAGLLLRHGGVVDDIRACAEEWGVGSYEQVSRVEHHTSAID